jgi:hypothetical protein
MKTPFAKVFAQRLLSRHHDLLMLIGFNTIAAALIGKCLA